MDGRIVNQRATVSAAYRPTALGGTQPINVAAAVTDALNLQRGAATSPIGGAAPAGPPGASAEQLIGELRAKLDTVQGLEAKRLTAFLAVVTATANDPTATAALAQAFKNPQANEGAARLNQLFANADEGTLAQLYYTAAVDDDEDGPVIQNGMPNNIFSAERVTGGELLASMVKEIYDPQAVLQGDRQTCGAATMQILLAREAPTEYVRLVTSLAFGGHAPLHSGGVLPRDTDWNDVPGDRRSLSSRLLQAAFMEYGNGNLEYDAPTDRNYSPNQNGGGRQGLTMDEFQRLLAGVTNQQVAQTQVKKFDETGRWVDSGDGKLAQTLAGMKTLTDTGMSVPVLLSVKPTQQFAHFQLVTRMDDDFVYGLNPWGQEEPMPRWLFEQRLIGAFFQ